MYIIVMLTGQFYVLFSSIHNTRMLEKKIQLSLILLPYFCFICKIERDKGDNCSTQT